MTTIPDDELYIHADRVKGKVTLITGGANGVGRESALLFSKHGAKIVIGDRDVKSAQKTVSDIVSQGGEAICQSCDVAVWEDQLALFELALSKYGAVDIVLPNAGVAEKGLLGKVLLEDGKPVKPRFTTIDINLVGVLYTIYLSQHYLKLNRTEGSLKAMILIGSIASWLSLPTAPLYAASKHAVLGVMRSLTSAFTREGIRIGCIHPFFADTAIVPTAAKILLAGIPKVPVERIAGAFFYAATDPDMKTNGSAYLLPDNGSVFRLEEEHFKLGVYKMIDERRNALLKAVSGVVHLANTIRDLVKILGKPLLLLGLAVVTAKVGWDYRATLHT